MNTAKTIRRTASFWIPLLLVVPLLLWAAGCDSNGGGGNGNASPSAEFRATGTSGLEVTFISESSDPDGTITAWDWQFGDGGTSTEENPTYTYAAEDEYEVTLTVTDDADAENTTTQSIQVGDTPQFQTTYDTTTVDGQPAIVVCDRREFGCDANNENGIGYADIDGNTVSEVTWTNNYVYILDGRTFVNDGQVLNIEPGTVIKGRPSSDPTSASVMIVAQGGQMFAEGTAEEPIIFTAEDDRVGEFNLPESTRGAWGGVMLLGTARNNTTPGVINIEGIPTDIARGQYGCGTEGVTCDNEDNSGVLRYVSIRYGGISIGEGNEINGLTMGGVGTGTTIEYVEVFNNVDDGFEWFGGTVNASHLVSAFNGDDSFDIDQGFDGNLQFLFAVQDPANANRAGEHDGGNNDLGGEDSEPLSDPQIYNATYVGVGMSPAGADNDLTLLLRDNWAGAYYNSIFTNFPEQAILIEDLDGPADSRERFEEGKLRIENNVFYGYGAGSTFAAIVANEGAFGDDLAAYLEANNIFAGSDVVQSVAFTRPQSAPAGGGLNPLPTDAATSAELAEYPAGFEPVNYPGAFAPGENWAAGWTALSQAGYFD